MKAHRFDIISFLAGLVFTGVGLLFLIPGDISQVWDVLVGWGDWFWPTVLLALGTVIIGAAVLPRKRSEAHEDDQPALTEEEAKTAL